MKTLKLIGLWALALFAVGTNVVLLYLLVAVFTDPEGSRTYGIGTAHAGGYEYSVNYSLRDKAEAAIERGSLERCYRRCEKNHAPLPSPSPKPTVAPIPCEPIGGVKTFVAGQDRMFCFNAADGSTFVEVASTSPANVGCAHFRTELTSPSGLKGYGEGAYPMGTVLRTPGRHYFWVSPTWIGDGDGCDTYTFTVR